MFWSSLTTALVTLAMIPALEAGGHQTRPADAERQSSGVIAGHVTPPESLTFKRPPQVVLMEPRWVDIWNGDVQKRLDVYWDRYRAAFAENREFFQEVANKARRDALVLVISRMQRELGAGFADLVKQVSAEGRFEFTGIPFGDYRVVVVGRAGERNLIWSEAVAIRSSIPQFIEVENRIQ